MLIDKQMVFVIVTICILVFVLWPGRLFTYEQVKQFFIDCFTTEEGEDRTLSKFSTREKEEDDK